MKCRSLSRLSAGRVLRLYWAGDVTAVEIPDKHGTFILGELRKMKGTFVEEAAQRKIDALKAVTTCGCGIKWETPGQCWKCEQRKRA